MAQATFRIETNDPFSPKDIPLSSLIGNDEQTASCGAGSITAPATVAQGAKVGQTLAEANAAALAQAEADRGACQWTNAEQTANCPDGYTGDPVVVAAGTYTSEVSQADADAQALAAAEGGLSCIPLAYDPSALFDSTGQIKALAIQSDGKILLGGNMAGTGSASAYHYIVRTNIDGTIDTSFAAHTFTGSSINRIRIGTSGQVWACGEFTVIDGSDHKRLVLFSSLGAVVGGDPNPSAFEAFGLDVQSDGKAIVCGPNFIKRYNTDGTEDTGFAPSASGTFNAVLVRADGKILIGGGNGMSVNSVSRNGIILLNADGTTDSSYNPNVVGGVNDLHTDNDGNVYACGGITNVGGVAYDGDVVKLDSSGARDATFNADDYDNGPTRICVLGDQSVIVSGNAVRSGAEMFHILADGTYDSSFTDITDASAIFDAVQRFGSRIAFVGQFSTIHGVARNKVAQVDLTGALA